jgi:hypothetical protein
MPLLLQLLLLFFHMIPPQVKRATLETICLLQQARGFTGNARAQQKAGSGAATGNSGLSTYLAQLINAPDPFV